jgi:hypothetical protein
VPIDVARQVLHFGMSAGVVEAGPIAERLTTWWQADER